jgi:hypothetical protein
MKNGVLCQEKHLEKEHPEVSLSVCNAENQCGKAKFNTTGRYPYFGPPDNHQDS